MNKDPLVAVRCLTYNHELYIAQCLEGILSQKADFPFIVIVHDDASTDRTPEIIKKYEQKYPDIIKVIYEKENQFSKKENSIIKIMNDATPSSVKYLAICEGDDYWIDPNKLQTQIDFMESHPDYSMCFSDANILFSDGHVENYNQYTTDCDAPFYDIVYYGGLFCPTASLVIRWSNFITWPDEFKNRHIGDYPLQIYLASVGKCRFFKKPLCVYRQNPKGWTHTNDKLKTVGLEAKMLDDFNNYFDYKYNDLFLLRKNKYCFQVYNSLKMYDMAYKFFKNIKKPVKHIGKKMVFKYFLYAILPIPVWNYFFNALNCQAKSNETT